MHKVAVAKTRNNPVFRIVQPFVFVGEIPLVPFGEEETPPPQTF
jgi:hypothetical protein